MEKCQTPTGSVNQKDHADLGGKGKSLRTTSQSSVSSCFPRRNITVERITELLVTGRRHGWVPARDRRRVLGVLQDHQ